MDPVRRRLDELESRVRALERALPQTSWRMDWPAVLEEAAVPAPTPSRPAAVERALAPVEPPLPRPPAETRPRPRRVPVARPERGELESWLGGVVLARIGIGAVVLAAAYFAQLAYRHVPDIGKVASLYTLAGLLLGAGHLLRTRGALRFVALLQGGAVAVAYVAGLAASLRYHLVGPEVGCALLAAAAALGASLARRLEVEGLAAVSVLGALAAPFLLRLTHEPHVLVLLFAAAISTWAGWAQARWGWVATRFAALLGAVVLGWTWYSAADGLALELRLVTLHAYTLALLAPELWAAWKSSGPELSLVPLAVGAVLALVCLLAGREAFGPTSSVLHGSCATLVSGALWLGLACLLGTPGRPKAAAGFAHGLAFVGGVALVVGSLIQWGSSYDEPIVFLLSLAATSAGLLLLRRRVGSGSAAATLAALFAWALVGAEASEIARGSATAFTPGAGLALLPLALVPAAALALLGRTGFTSVAGTLLGALTLFTAFVAPALELNPDCWTAAFGVTALWLGLVAAIARRRGEPWAAGGATVALVLLAGTWVGVALARDRVPGWVPPVDPFTAAAVAVAFVALAMRRLFRGTDLPREDGPAWLVASALGLLLLAGGREVHLASRSLEGAWGPVLLSVYITLAAACVLWLGFRNHSQGLRVAALLLFAGVIAKVGGHDLAAAALELRVFVTLILGLVLLACAYAYSRGERDPRARARPAWRPSA